MSFTDDEYQQAIDTLPDEFTSHVFIRKLGQDPNLSAFLVVLFSLSYRQRDIHCADRGQGILRTRQEIKEREDMLFGCLIPFAVVSVAFLFGGC